MLSYDLTIILPTFNEVHNVPVLVKELFGVLKGVNFEILFIDDNSQDGTSDAIEKICDKHSNVRLIKRVDARGIASAFTDGYLNSKSTYVAIMDADLQHDSLDLKQMFDVISHNKKDLVIGSRFLSTSRISGLSKFRSYLSKLGNWVCRLISGQKLSDPLTGFFIIKRSVLDQCYKNLTGIGFKILLDIIATTHRLDMKLGISEVQINFRNRKFGKSKLDSLIVLEFLTLICNKLFGFNISVRFFSFIFVGFSGLFLNLVSLALLLKFAGMSFVYSQGISIFIAMLSNFYLNNLFTYRDKRISGLKNLIKACMSFCVACSIGALINWSIAVLLFDFGIHWTVASTFGVIVSAVWNYVLSTYLVWGNKL